MSAELHRTKSYVELLAAQTGPLNWLCSAEEANKRSENIGARRLYTIMEALLEELSYDASERADSKFAVDVSYVKSTLDPILANEDLAKYIL